MDTSRQGGNTARQAITGAFGPIQSVDDLATGVFESDEELEEFIAFTYAERRGDTWPDSFRSGPA